MITIAGLHMSIVAGCVFIAIRWALALIPMIALTYPIKKWAAAGALVATTFYLLISGTHVSAERAYLMGAIMLLAIIFGRPALTMRNLALAALVLIVRDPEQVVEPGFLMSFLAVMALIAAYRAYWAYRQTRPEAPDHAGLLGHVTRHILNHGLGAMWSTLIATFATAFVTADQFYRVPPFGALSNMIVLPAIDLVAMPAAVVACLLMPFGLEVIPLTAMGWAIDFMNAVGAIAATVPGATGLIGRIHPWSVALQVAGLCWLCLWHRSWRLLGLAPIVLALCLAPFAVRPDIMIGPSAMPVAVRGADGQLKVLGALKNRFTVASWLTADAAPSAPADPRAPLDPAIGDGWTCDALGCVFTLPAEASGRTIARIAVVNDARGFDEDCGKATVVITRLAAPDWCADRAIVFDHDRLLQTGAVALRFDRSPDQSTTKTPPAVADATEPEEDRPQPTVTIAIARPQQPRAWMTAPPMPPKPVAAPAIAAPAPPSRALPAKPAESSDARSPEDAAIDALDDPLSTTGDSDPLRVQSRQTPAKPNRYRAARPDILPFDPTDLPDVNEP
jgi:competence protein ComEC